MKYHPKTEPFPENLTALLNESLPHYQRLEKIALK
jgi:hypothetical protein